MKAAIWLIATASVAVRKGSEHEFLRGDANGDRVVNVTDAVVALRFLFDGGTVACEDTVDVDDDGRVNLADVARLLDYLFGSGDSPAAPFPEPGGDPTGDELEC